MFNYIFNNKPIIVYIIPFFLGCLTILSFQPFNFTIINFIIFPFLFFIISYINKKSKNTYRKKPFLVNLFYVGYLFGIGFFFAGTYWISNSLTFDENFKGLIPFTLIIIPLVLGLFFGLGTLLSGRFIKFDIKSLFLLSAVLSLIDFFRAKIFTGFPWNLWAYSWSWFTEMIQILNPIGLFAFNLLSITIFLVPAIFFFKKFKYRGLIVILFSLLLFSNYMYGNYILNNNEKQLKKYLDQDKFIDVKIISPNFDLKYYLSDSEIEERINKLIKFSEIDKNKKTLFIWPEGALSGKYFFEIKKYKKIINENFTKNHLIIFGINTYDKKEDKFYNSFVVVDHNLNKLFQYDKIKLVPFGEFLPMDKLFERIDLKKITEGFGSFSKGKIQKNYLYNDINILPLICYEIIFTELIQKITNKKNLIVNISEDAWFGNSIGPHQHFSKSIFRAVESNSFVIRSTNKGISALINNKGKIDKSLKNNESGNLELRIPVFESNDRNKNDLIFFVLLFTYGFIFIIYKKK
tara:strand:- start:227 stop:1786 length:1560 start_codon:yes stop_codon:yes gene_type:complete